MKRYLKIISIILLLSTLVFLHGFTKHKNSAKTITGTEIFFQNGTHSFLTHNIVNKLLIQNDSNLLEKPKSIINLQALENNILSNPYVEEASVFLTIDGTLKTTVKQRIPIARISTKSSIYYIDKQGFNVPLSVNYSARVPIISGAVIDKNKADVLRLANFIFEDSLLKKEVIGINITSQNEFDLQVRSGNYKIELGKLDELRVKFAKLKAFYNKAFTDQTIHQYKKINLKYHNQVVCTK